jgi:hypothetical protein
MPVSPTIAKRRPRQARKTSTPLRLAARVMPSRSKTRVAAADQAVAVRDGGDDDQAGEDAEDEELLHGA